MMMRRRKQVALLKLSGTRIFFGLLLTVVVIGTVLPVRGDTITTPPAASAAARRKLVVGVDGGTESIRACCFDALTGQVVGEACASPYTTHHPQPGWAEQNPTDWYEQLGVSVRGAIESITREKKDDQVYEIWAICIDTTCCSVVLLDDDNRPLRPALLWMDARSAPQTREILQKCMGDPALDINCGGEGPLSAEWMTPKALWIRQNEPELWAKAKTICEYQDYINFKLTGGDEIVASSCNAATRWHFDGEECIKERREDTEPDTLLGRPLSMYQILGIPELAQKLPKRCLPMGATIGKLSSEAAEYLNLPEGLPVVQGGPDAFVGMIGLGCIHPGQLCLITGSSHLHCIVTSQPSTSPGIWGAYRGAPLPGLSFAEGGQSSTGSIARWAKSKLFGVGAASVADDDNTLSYQTLDEEASRVPPGCDGLVALETFQGSRTPVTDPLARGALVGLTLSHTRAHVWRALLESVCFGTRACIEGLSKAGHAADEIIMAGGATRSPLWLQMHSDVTGLPVVVCENGGDAPLLGCAVLASVGVGIHKDVETAVQAMIRRSKRVVPNKDVSKTYTSIYDKVYCKLVESARPVAHAIASLRGGGGGGCGDDSRPHFGDAARKKTRTVTISPSLLAADFADIKGAVAKCIHAKASRLHVDIFDGVFLDSPNAFTFGPQMVKAIRKSCDNLKGNDDSADQAVLDLHMCVDRPLRFVQAMADAGGDVFIFQWEAMSDANDVQGSDQQLMRATELTKAVVNSGMQCGVSINPATSVEEIYPLLETGLVDLVDVLGVEPGFGGQKFQIKTIQKVATLKEWRDSHRQEFDILVDGGINQQTAADVLASGADILVAGTFLFQHPSGLADGVKELLNGISIS